MISTTHQKRKKYHIIYKTTNLINGKIYIGAHSTDNLNDGYLGSGDNIVTAIKKYGKNNFIREILYMANNSEEMFKTEASIVTEEFIKRKNVYNIVSGGHGGTNKGSSGLKHLHNSDGETCAVHASCVDKMLIDGWILGRNSSSTTGTVWIHKNDERKMISPDLLEEHTIDGWKRGLPNSPTSGKKWIYHAIFDKYSLCDIKDIDIKISEGWILKKWSPIPLGSVRKKIKCVHCGKFSDQGNHNKWHGNKCKFR